MSFIKQHIYLFLLLLTTTEGPITSFVSAGFAAQGALRIEYVFAIALLWDVIWDVVLYMIGRFLYKIKRIQRQHQKITNNKLYKNLYEKYPFLFFLIVKITPYLSAPSLISTGIKKRNFFSFLKYSFFVSIIVKTVYITIGYLWSVSLGQLNKFLDGRKMAIIYIVGWVLLFRWIKKLYQRLAKVLREEAEEIK